MRKSTQSSKLRCDTVEQKAQLRKKISDELAALPESYIESSNAQIAKKLFAMPEYAAAKRVFAYYSVGREVSTQGIIEHALSQGKQVALPVCESKGIMHFVLVHSLSELKKGRYGIPEPSEDGEAVTPNADDIIIVPALCADKSNNRLGHGAGYYDRYLAKAECFSVCLCRKRLLKDALPAEPTDYKVSAVITE